MEPSDNTVKRLEKLVRLLEDADTILFNRHTMRASSMDHKDCRATAQALREILRVAKLHDMVLEHIRTHIELDQKLSSVYDPHANGEW
jgi:division protein CdvB (Snf7/Vps24/ESCRT-III family)